MSPLEKEAALVVNFVTALFTALVLYGRMSNEQAQALNAVVVAGIPVAIVLAGAVIRAFVFSRRTIEKAGLDPEQVVERARDPAVVPHKRKGGR